MMKDDMKELSRALQGFEQVWKRVTAGKSAHSAAAEQGLKLMPGKSRKKGASRFSQGRR